MAIFLSLASPSTCPVRPPARWSLGFQNGVSCCAVESTLVPTQTPTHHPADPSGKKHHPSPTETGIGLIR